MFNLKGKVAIVTGGSKGIGAGIAKALSEAGATVVVTSHIKKDSERIVAEIINSGGKALACELDVTKENDIKIAIEKAVDEFGDLDILVNNAAVTTFKEATSLSMDDWDYIFDVNGVVPASVSEMLVLPHIQSERVTRTASEVLMYKDCEKIIS